MLRATFLLLTLALTAACSGPSTQVLVAAPSPDLRLTPRVSSLEVREISLPRYAAADALVVLDSSGELQEVKNTIWADNPERNLTLALARNIGVITGARVAAEPWPFAEPPAAQVTIRVEQLLGQPDGQLQMSGQYAIAPVASGLTDRSGRFSISVPVLGESPAALANAQGRAIAELSETVARRLAR